MKLGFWKGWGKPLSTLVGATGGGENLWYLAGGIPVENVIAAYQPLGATSYTESKLNLVNPATHALVDTGRVVSWDTANGWIGASGTALTTNITPTIAYTSVVRYKDLSTTAEGAMFQTYNFGNWYYGIVNVASAVNPVRFTNGQTNSFFTDKPGVIAGGTAALAGRMCYVDGVNVATLNDSAWSGSPTAVILMNRTGYDRFFVGKILAWAIYNITLDAQVISALHTAMAALPSATSSAQVYQGAITVEDLSYTSSIDP